MTMIVETERPHQVQLRPGPVASPAAPARPAPLPQRWAEIPDHLLPVLLPPAPVVETAPAEGRARQPGGGTRTIERVQVPVLDRARLGTLVFVLFAALALIAGTLSGDGGLDPSARPAPVASAVDATPDGERPPPSTGCTATTGVSEILRLSAPHCSGAIR